MLQWLKKKFLTFFGRIKVSKYPFWFSYCPEDYQVKGKQFREAIEILSPGYVIGRGYKDYLDGYFIPGSYSHTGICCKNSEWEQLMIHSMAYGVFQQDLVDFLRCDKFIIFKPKKGMKKAVQIAKSLIGKKYDFDFKDDNDSYYCHEMTATCFPDLDIKKKDCGLGVQSYTIDSFIDSPDFEIVYEYNPQEGKYGIIK